MFRGVFDKIIIPLSLTGYKMIIACSAHLTSNVRSWNIMDVFITLESLRCEAYKF